MHLLDTFRLVLAPPHPAGRPFLAIAAVAMVAGLVFAHWLFWLALLFGLFCLYFFRDPERVPPTRSGAIVAPADGRVVMVCEAVPPEELGLGPQPRWRVAIFLSVLNVHVNRVPASGTITRIAYRHGRFLNAALDKASIHNERNALALRGRFGIIRFGSRTDLYLPPGVLPLVEEGQLMIGGETVIAELGADPAFVA